MSCVRLLCRLEHGGFVRSCCFARVRLCDAASLRQCATSPPNLQSASFVQQVVLIVRLRLSHHSASHMTEQRRWLLQVLSQPSQCIRMSLSAYLEVHGGSALWGFWTARIQTYSTGWQLACVTSAMQRESPTMCVCRFGVHSKISVKGLASCHVKQRLSHVALYKPLAPLSRARAAMDLCPILASRKRPRLLAPAATKRAARALSPQVAGCSLQAGPAMAVPEPKWPPPRDTVAQGPGPGPM
mmetsp:Transcript_5141/g.8491  ORF Transcript_5141/g.8491 Transcript_5141/m.8491 type:complete len:242 (-) Transcript_5141:257-982(-)